MHLYTHQHYHAPRLSALGELNAIHALRSAASGISAIFIPLFLYDLGYSLTAILGYLFLLSLVWLLTLYPTSLLIQRVGVRFCIALSIVTGAIELLLLIALSAAPIPLPLIALFGGLTVSLYWTSFRIAFAQLMAHRNPGRSVGISNALLIFAGGAAPAVGGLIATLFGTSVLYGTAIALCVLTFIPLLRLPHLTIPKLKPVPLRKAYPDVMTNVAFNIDDAAAGNVWPLFIFFFISSYAGVGALTSVTLLATILISLYVGSHERRKGVGRYLHLGSGITGAANFFRILVENSIHIFSVNFVSGAGKSMAATPFLTRYYQHIETWGSSYLLIMLLGGALGWTVYFGSLTLLTFVASTQVVVLIGLLAAAPMILFALRMR